MIKTAYDVFVEKEKEEEKEKHEPVYGDNWGELDKDSWGSEE